MSDRYHEILAKYFFKILRKQSVIDGWKAETRINGRENSIQPLALIGQTVSVKKIFKRCVWTKDWPRSRDDLDSN